MIQLEIETWCDCDSDKPAKFTISMIDSVSMGNLSYGCSECIHDFVSDWIFGYDFSDVQGWEIKRL